VESAGSFVDEKKLQKHLPEPALVLEDSSEQQQQYNEACMIQCLIRIFLIDLFIVLILSFKL
jgi:hypothetical protein